MVMSFANVQRRTGRFVLVLVAFSVFAGPGALWAQENPPTDPVIRVEEDWLLWVVEPDGALYAPQFHTAMSPFAHLDSYYFQVTWNYRELPDFMSGGFQVQSWDGEDNLDRQNVNSAELSRVAEIITWTQVLETNGTQIGFSVEHGVSSTWSTFGHPETTIVHDGSFSDLSQYSPEVSINNSWITYGQNRVFVLKIREVRYFGANGLLQTDGTQRVVYHQGATN
jgi:hypothetical protein